LSQRSNLQFPIAYCAPDYLEQPDVALDREQILALRQSLQTSLFSPRAARYRQAVETVADLKSDRFCCTEPVVTIGAAGELTVEQQQRLELALRAFCPWKKGPYAIFGIEIDAEWRSDWKWARLVPHLRSLQGQKIADIGCHNGYFMFRMLAEQPDCIIGFEPYAKNFWNFQLMQNMVRRPELHFELLGVEQIDLYPKVFDTIFCLGILYHHTDPIGLLRKLHGALAPEGEIVIDCQGIAGDLPVALTPNRRYANATGIYFLPTQSCLENWLVRAGFKHIRSIFAEPLSTEEQRRTPWANIESLQEFLDPSDPSKTIEGYPAPWRFYAIAHR
jgi:tRNA (mo5U34)-methyltransferase